MVNFADYIDYSNPNIDPKCLDNRVKHLIHKHCPPDILRLVNNMDVTIAFQPYYFQEDELAQIKEWAWNNLNGIENKASVEDRIEPTKPTEPINNSNSITNLDLDF